MPAFTDATMSSNFDANIACPKATAPHAPRMQGVEISIRKCPWRFRGVPLPGFRQTRPPEAFCLPVSVLYQSRSAVSLKIHSGNG